VRLYTGPETCPVVLEVYNSGGYNSTRKAGYITMTRSAKVGVYRNFTHTFYLDKSGNGAWGSGDTT
jgi:hypothetical protein